MLELHMAEVGRNNDAESEDSFNQALLIHLAFSYLDCDIVVISKHFTSESLPVSASLILPVQPVQRSAVRRDRPVSQLLSCTPQRRF